MVVGQSWTLAAVVRFHLPRPNLKDYTMKKLWRKALKLYARGKHKKARKIEFKMLKKTLKHNN